MNECLQSELVVSAVGDVERRKAEPAIRFRYCYGITLWARFV